MSTELVVNVKHDIDFDVYIGRGCRGYKASKWANPFKITGNITREQAIERYRAWIQEQPHLMACIGELHGKVLGCWCAPKACHGDVLVELSQQ